MSWASSEAVTVLAFLLPGFVAVAIFQSFTSHPKPSDFERVVQALIFTIVVQATVQGILWVGRLLGRDSLWPSAAEIVVTVGIAILVAFLTVAVMNNDILHGFFRWLRFTKETSFASEWYSSFHRHPDCYVVLHLQGERRVFGWPAEWPSRPDQGHFRIQEAEWLVGRHRIPVEGVEAMVVPARMVEVVEFIPVDPIEEQSE